MPDTPVPIALCGAGMIARVHGTSALHIGATISAVASRDPRRAVDLTAHVGGRAVMFDELPADADVVVVCTPPALHTSHALGSAARGAAVLIEKPLCTTLDDADRLVAAADGGARLVYAENLVHAPVVEAFLERVPALGRLDRLEVRSMQGLPTWGDVTGTAWGGGALFDLGAHPLAVMLLVADAGGCGRPTSVVATMRAGASHRVDEHADVTVMFENGARCDVVASWQAGPTPVWDIQASSDTGVLRAEVLPRTTLEHNGEPLVVASSPYPAPFGSLGFAPQLRRVAEGGPPRPDMAFGRQVLEMTCAAYESASRGGTLVTLPYSGRRDRTPADILRG